MLYARNLSGNVVEAAPKERAVCPHCNGNVIAKCGRINIWHWAHENNSECDIWAEHETEWHLSWKKLFPLSMTEQTIKKGEVSHRADVNTGKFIVEFQHSPIAPEDIFMRQWFYGQALIWVFNVSDAIENERLDIRHYADKSTFRWKHPKKHIAFAKQAALDLGDNRIFILRKMYPDPPCGGVGLIWTKEQFIKYLLP